MRWTPRKKSLAALCLSAPFFLFLLLHLLARRPDFSERLFATKQQQPVLVIDSPWTRRVERHPVENYRELPTGQPVAFPKVQVAFVKETSDARFIRQSRREAVKNAFVHSWQGYRERAWLADELLPVSGGNRSSFGGWSATLVDSLDTLWIMDLREEFDEAVEAVAGIDFQQSGAKTVIIFETTIRYLGGLLSAYELSGRAVLLRKALELGNFLYAAFDTPNRMPIPYFDWENALHGGSQDTSDHEISADLGSLSLEFTKLSELSGDARFFDAIQRIMEALAAQQDNSHIPGLWPVFVNTRSQDLASGNEFSLGALADSLYEYLSKMDILLGGLEPMYGKMFEKAIDAAAKHLFFRPMTPDNRTLLFSGISRWGAEGGSLDPSPQHLACFVGGMVGMGSRLYSRTKDLDAARALTDACYWAYESMLSGIMPENIVTVACPSTEDCSWSEEAWHSAVRSRADLPAGSDVQDLIQKKRLPPGIAQIADGRYILRPEAIESIFYMYRITGEPEWQEKAWNMFQAIEKASKAQYGYSAIENVAADPLKQANSMESFWTAETLKYLYLLFSDIDKIDLDEWVFNTEAHPFRRRTHKRSWW